MKNATSTQHRFFSIAARVDHALDRFFFRPASPRPLAALRIGLAACLLLQAFFCRHDVIEFFSPEGLVQGALASFLSVDHTPSLQWLADHLAPYGVSESTCLYGVCLAYVISLCLMLVGLFTRASTIACWFLHWTLMYSGYTQAYGADLFGHVFLFYLCWMPAGDAWSLDVRLGRREGGPSSLARLGIRVLQLHLCIMYLCSGIEKASGIQWWNGELLWRAFSLPVYHQFDMSWLAHWPWISMIAGWTTLLVELGYIVFIWPRATRRIWVFAAIGLHLGIAVFLGLAIFGFIMCVLTGTLFGLSAEPHAWELSSDGLKRTPGKETFTFPGSGLRQPSPT